MAESASDQIKAALRRKIPPKAIQRATARALNKTIVTVRAEAARGVKQELPSLKVSDIKSVLNLERVKASVAASQQSVALVVPAKAISLAKFSPRTKKVKTSRGVRTGVTVKVKGDRKLVVGGFLLGLNTATGRYGAGKGDGGLAIFTRKGAGRSPVRKRFSTTVRDIFLNDSFIDPLEASARSRLEVVLSQELAFELSKVKS